MKDIKCIYNKDIYVKQVATARAISTQSYNQEEKEFWI